MLGVRFGAVCTIVLGGMLISSGADAAQTCERGSRTCKPAATQSSRESATAASTQRAATARRTRRAARHRHGVKQAQTASPARRSVESSVAPAVESSVAPAVGSPVRESTPATRRFSEFVSPRLLAANPIEDLHKPRMNVSEFSGQTAYPADLVVDRERTGAAVDTPAAVPQHTVAQIESAEVARVPNQQVPATGGTEASGPSENQVIRSGERDSPDGSTSWLRIVFLTWGGLLTLGSALRLLIG
jgi:hypothetical protein